MDAGGGSVRVLGTYDGDLIAGGVFGQAGGVAARNIARWDGTNWAALGPGFNGNVEALVVYNGALIAGGSFNASGSTTTNAIARWDGTLWQPMGRGVNSAVWELWVFNGSLFAGGHMTAAGGKSSFHIARWDDTLSAAVTVSDPEPGRQGTWLAPGHPNPFTSRVTITYVLPRSALAKITVHDLQGRHVATLFEGRQGQGRHTVAWDGRDGEGVAVPAGVYVVRLTTGGETISGRMVRLR
jgi:hypothetical protein